MRASTPASSRTSRTAVSSGFSPSSTIPFGSCQRRFGPTRTMATSGLPAARRYTTPPAETWRTTGKGDPGISLCASSLVELPLRTRRRVVLLFLLPRSRWLELHLDPPLRAPIERFVCIDDVGHRLDLCEDLGWIECPRRDQIDELRDVATMIAVARLDREVLPHRLTDGEALHRRRIDANDSQRSRFRDHLDCPAQHLSRSVAGLPVLPLGMLLGRDLADFLLELRLVLFRFLARGAAVRMLCIDAHCIDDAIDADATRELHNHFRRIFLLEIDHLRTLGASQLQS